MRNKIAGCVLFFLVCISIQGLNAGDFKDSSADFQDLPSEVQARLKAEIRKNIPSGLHLSKDSQSYVYSAPHDATLSQNSAAYTATLSNVAPGSLQVTEGRSEFSVQLMPLIPGLGKPVRAAETISNFTTDGIRLTYFFKRNGIKEDIVLSKAAAKDLALSYFLKLDASLEARLDAEGNLVVYGPESREIAAKDRLLFVIPAPVVIDGKGQGKSSLARFSYHDQILTIHNSDLSSLAAPVTIDPSVVVTTTSDFKNANNEGLASPSTYDSMYVRSGFSLGYTTSLEIGSWFSTNPLSPGRAAHTAVTYNGFIYVLGGNLGGVKLNSVTYASTDFMGNVTGGWTTSPKTFIARESHASVAYNGYLYVIGGLTGAGITASVQYAAINPDGSLGDWLNATNLPEQRWLLSAQVYKGYMYALGGEPLFGLGTNTVYYAKIKGDGSLGNWTAIQPFVGGRSSHGSAIYDGRMYILGGIMGGGELGDIQTAKLMPDGTLSLWKNAGTLSGPRSDFTCIAASGYIYIFGGGQPGFYQGDGKYARIFTSGKIGPWSTATANMPTARAKAASVYMESNTGLHLYVIGGQNGAVLNDVLFTTTTIPTGHVENWTLTTALPSTTAFLAAEAYRGFVYALGGDLFSGNSTSRVLYAPIASDGTIGTWNPTSSLPFINFWKNGATVFYNGYVYVTGGKTNGGVVVNSVLYAKVNSDGTLGVWNQTLGFAPAQHGRFLHTAVAYGGYLYISGGTEDDVTLSGNTRYSKINADGTLAGWSDTGTLNARGAHASVAYNGFIYLIGGTSNVSVVRAAINTDGTLQPWISCGNLPNASIGRAYLTSVVLNDRLYVIGGIGGNSDQPSNRVDYARINADGSLDSWQVGDPLPSNKMGHASVVHNGYVYVIGGKVGNLVSASTDEVLFARIETLIQDGNISWSAPTTFTTGRSGAASAAYNGYLYMSGGFTGAGYLNELKYARINVDGSLDPWTTTSFPPPPRAYHALVAYKGYLYMLGGELGPGAILSGVRYSALDPITGAPGPWNPATNLMNARKSFGAVANNGFLYVLGGDATPDLNDVEYAAINADGSLGNWNSTNSFTGARYGHAVVTHSGYIYMIGGVGASGDLREVLLAKTNPNGTLQPWANGPMLTKARHDPVVSASNGVLHAIGGLSGGVYQSDSEYSLLTTGGMPGDWVTTGVAFANPRAYSAGAAYDGYFYMLGGYNGSTYFDDVQYTALRTMSPRGAFSKLIDLGSSRIIDSLQFTSATSQNIVNVNYAVAPDSSAIFGARATFSAAPSGALLTGGPVCGRYLWAHFELDDSNYLANDSFFGRKNVDDFTVNYQSSMSAVGNNHKITKTASAVLTWLPVQNATSYQVLRCNVPPSGPCNGYAVIADTTALSYSDPVLGDGNYYWYMILAANDECISN